MEKVFKLKGTLKDSSDKVIPNLFLVIVDEDSLDEDDLIGLGTTDENGSFQISFLASEFQQDMFEDEKTPDIKIIVSSMFGNVRKAIYQRTFPDLDWKNNEVDLGDIILEGVNIANPIPLEDVEPLPGINKRAERLEIDNEMVKQCMAEVAPIVEKLTGWSNLLDGLKFEVADSLTPYMLRETFKAQGTDPNSFEAKFAAFFADFAQGPGAGCALYDPHIHTVIINKKIMEQVGIEALKIMCGHELVHVGQFKYTPGLKEYNLAHLQSMRADAQNTDMEAVKAKGAYMFELEGYAKYIETDFLYKKYYRMVLLSYHASTWEKIMQGLIAMLSPGVKETKELKASQYTDGLEMYRKRQVGDIPVRFQLDVSTLPGGAEFVSQAQKGN